LLLGIVNLISALLSLFGSSFVVVQHLLFSRQLVISQLIYYLALADLVASLSIAISQGWLLITTEYSLETCITLRSFIEFSVVASFFWSSSIAFYLFYAIVLQNDIMLTEGNIGTGTKKHTWTTSFMIAFHTICWGIPLVLCVILASAGWYQKYEGGWCHPQQPFLFIFWQFPMIFSFFINALIYTIISIFLKRRSHKAGSKSHLSGKIQGQMALFVLVYAVCWAPNVVSHLESFIFPDCWLFWLGFLQNALSPAQGFLNCIVYGLANQQARMRYRWWQHILLFFLSPSIVLPILTYTTTEACVFMVSPSLHDRFFPQRSDRQVSNIRETNLNAWGPLPTEFNSELLEDTDT